MTWPARLMAVEIRWAALSRQTAKPAPGYRAERHGPQGQTQHRSAGEQAGGRDTIRIIAAMHARSRWPPTRRWASMLSNSIIGLLHATKLGCEVSAVEVNPL